LHAAELPPEREQFEITFNKTKYDCAAPKVAGRSSLGPCPPPSQELTWKAIDRYSKDYVELQTKDKVKFYKTPDAILQQQLDLYDQIVAKKSGDNRSSSRSSRRRRPSPSAP
jgi:TRAP-type mannitol/chloroaromatic compound transport system substrate-binding protein